MSYPEQKDYGSADSKALVPGTLTVFRHFIVDTERGNIAPMSWNPKRSGYVSANDNPAQRPYPRPTDLYEPSVHTAECSRRTQPYMIESPYTERFDTPRHPKSPTEWCSCGFYAHYDPETDFYPSHRWGRAYARLSGQHDIAGLVVVKAVCEVSGTVVMGRLGVRAEKMKIVAIAIDWDKQIKPTEHDRYRRNAYNWGGPRFGDFLDELYTQPDPYDYYDEKQEDDDRFTEETVAMIAHRYRVKHYTDVGKMHGDHPKADISALGVDTTPRPRPRNDFDFALQLNQPISVYSHQAALYHAQMASQATQAAAQLASTAQVASATIRGWYDEMIRAENAKPKRKPKRDQLSVPQAVQDVIDARASRPAPPGAGIDRRRGRLR